MFVKYNKSLEKYFDAKSKALKWMPPAIQIYTQARYQTLHICWQTYIFVEPLICSQSGIYALSVYKDHQQLSGKK